MSIDSFNGLKNLYNEVKQTLDINKILIYVVGNKNDQYEHEQVKKETANQYAKSIKAKFRLVSALDSSGINELFENVATSFCHKGENEPEETNDQNVGNKEFSLSPDDKESKEKKEKKKCC